MAKSDKIKKGTETVINKASEIVKNTAETIQKSEKVNEAVKTTKKAVKKASETAKKTAAKASEKAGDAAKEVARKAAVAKKKLSSPIVTSYIQYGGKEVSQNDIVRMICEACEIEKKSIEDLKLYFKPEEDAVYYVINGLDTGKVQL